MSGRNEWGMEKKIHKKGFHHLFQPIYVLENWHVFGYEVLLRRECTPSPELLFRVALQKTDCMTWIVAQFIMLSLRQIFGTSDCL